MNDFKLWLEALSIQKSVVASLSRSVQLEMCNERKRNQDSIQFVFWSCSEGYLKLHDSGRML